MSEESQSNLSASSADSSDRLPKVGDAHRITLAPAGPDKEHQVGYRKPPPETRFKPGRSGNPGGRPKASKNLATLLSQTIAERVAVVENGQPHFVSKLEAALKQLTDKARSGDLRAVERMIALTQWLESRAETLPDPPMSEADREVIVAVYRRLMAREQEGES